VKKGSLEGDVSQDLLETLGWGVRKEPADAEWFPGSATPAMVKKTRKYFDRIIAQMRFQLPIERRRRPSTTEGTRWRPVRVSGGKRTSIARRDLGAEHDQAGRGGLMVAKIGSGIERVAREKNFGVLFGA